MAQSKKIGNTTVQWFTGDLTNLDVEAFVFYAQDNLDLGSGFGTAITGRGGVKIKQELQAIGSVGPSQVVVTEAGLLKANYILHANGPKFQEADTENKLKTTMRNTLKAAEEKGIKKIAFPAMGAGFYGIPKPVCAKIMHDALKEGLSAKSGIEEVMICLLENRELAAFNAELN
jgi:O-acetyl-ADP-ribose deacetylase